MPTGQNNNIQGFTNEHERTLIYLLAENDMNNDSNSGASNDDGAGRTSKNYGSPENNEIGNAIGR